MQVVVVLVRLVLLEVLPILVLLVLVLGERTLRAGGAGGNRDGNCRWWHLAGISRRSNGRQVPAWDFRIYRLSSVVRDQTKVFLWLAQMAQPDRDRLTYLSISFKVVRDNFFVRFCCERSNTSVYMNGWHNLKRKEVHISIFHKVLRSWYASKISCGRYLGIGCSGRTWRGGFYEGHVSGPQMCIWTLRMKLAKKACS